MFILYKAKLMEKFYDFSMLFQIFTALTRDYCWHKFVNTNLQACLWMFYSFQRLHRDVRKSTVLLFML